MGQSDIISMISRINSAFDEPLGEPALLGVVPPHPSDVGGRPAS
jgi:hypothetical protein